MGPEPVWSCSARSARGLRTAYKRQVSFKNEGRFQAKTPNDPLPISRSRPNTGTRGLNRCRVCASSGLRRQIVLPACPPFRRAHVPLGAIVSSSLPIVWRAARRGPPSTPPPPIGPAILLRRVRRAPRISLGGWRRYVWSRPRRPAFSTRPSACPGRRAANAGGSAGGMVERMAERSVCCEGCWVRVTGPPAAKCHGRSTRNFHRPFRRPSLLNLLLHSRLVFPTP